jgi:hypothetical protein
MASAFREINWTFRSCWINRSVSASQMIRDSIEIFVWLVAFRAKIFCELHYLRTRQIGQVSPTYGDKSHRGVKS